MKEVSSVARLSVILVLKSSRSKDLEAILLTGLPEGIIDGLERVRARQEETLGKPASGQG